jgi:hypothetical protein
MARGHEGQRGIEHRHVDMRALPVAWRCTIAPRTASAAVCPASVSTIGKPTRTGGSPSPPLSIIIPAVAWTMLSIAGQSRCGLSCP